MKWANIRLPVELKARLDALCEKELAAYQQQRIKDLPEGFIDRDRVPVYYIIEKAIDHLERKRTRSNGGKAQCRNSQRAGGAMRRGPASTASCITSDAS